MTKRNYFFLFQWPNNVCKYILTYYLQIHIKIFLKLYMPFWLAQIYLVGLWCLIMIWFTFFFFCFLPSLCPSPSFRSLLLFLSRSYAVLFLCVLTFSLFVNLFNKHMCTNGNFDMCAQAILSRTTILVASNLYLTFSLKCIYFIEDFTK